MKKSNILKLVFIILLVPNFYSCSDLLEEKVDTFYSADQVFNTKEGIEVALNGMYSSMANPDYYGTSWHGLINPMSGRFYSNQEASVDATSLNCTPINIWLPKLWQQMYTTINVSNNIIYNIQNNGVDLSNENTALGQAYFVRAVTYFDLVRLFGDIPLRTVPTTINNVHMPKSPKAVVYQQIISDFELAKQMLPDTGEYLVDRPKKWAAYGYLAKVYMTLAGQDGGDQANWTLAKNELEQVIGKYSLNPSYSGLFTPGTENTVESIFELQYAQVGAVRNSDIVRFYTPQNSTFVPQGQITFGRIRPNKEVFDSHLAQYPGDPRIATTFISGSYQRYNTSGVLVNQNIYPNTTTGNYSFPYIKKWLDPAYNGTTTNRNYILFRYADVLLMMAEIENEINGPTAAYQYVNQVLTRARNSSSPAAAQPANWSAMTQDEFRTRIMHERRYELLSEGQDWFDTRRRGYQYFLNEIVYPHNNYSPNQASGTDYTYPVSVKNMLLPIPAAEISGNQAMSPSDQNPGY